MSKQRVMKNYEELMFRDDFMFGKVMEDPELCREVLECLLQRPVGELKRLFYNCSYDGEDISKDLKELYDYVRNGHANNKLTGKIEQAVDKGRKNALWRTQYMKEWVIIQDAKDEGIEEGAELQLIKQVCRKLKKSKSPEQIAEELDEDEVHIQVLCDIASGFAPDYDVDMILDAVLDNKMV